jgi:hypothetical protein
LRSCATANPGGKARGARRILQKKRHDTRDAALERLHIRSPRIPAAGGARDARMHAALPPRLAGIRAGGLTRFAFPSRFANSRDSGIKKRMRGAAESKTESNRAPQVAYRCGDSTG